MHHLRTRRLAAAGLAAVLTLGAAACGSSSGSDSSSGGSSGPITSLAALCGHSVAVEKGTTQLDDATAQGKKCKAAGKGDVKVLSFQDQGGANLALSSGRADVAMADSPVAAYAVKQSKGKFKLSDPSYGDAPYGIAVPKGADYKGLDTAIQAALVKLESDGTYGKILSTWGVQAGSVKDFPINGATGGKAPASASSDPASLVPAKIKSNGTITVAADASYAPNEFFDTDNKTVIGMDADLAKALGKELGLKVDVTNANFDAIIPALGSRFDLGMSSFTDNADREKTVDFVDYFSAGTSFYVPA